ncbi:hypothetical protein D9757_008096 [Collybiopsis confluens]|uniref:Uncharacterized protein n=1 Tax=Collybiopsis confluens TaxID=2823264 RepID=A0A8H5H720_9AGAR|nr:hypothetical protein D9757_008096 [Collybiopsis confluens]
MLAHLTMGPKVALLQSFPTPPSFMPPSPTSAAHPLDASTFSVTANPPLSSPPTGPLPPVPGRSRISEHEAALILQSRRNSRHSDYSSSSGRPDSVASFASAKSNAAGYTGSIHNHRDDNRERRWLSRTVRTPAVQVTAEISEDTNQAYGGLRIDGEDGQDVLLTSLRFTVSSLPPSPTDSEHDLVIPPALSTQFPTPPPLSPFAIQQASAMWKASSSTGSSPLKLSAPPSPFSAAPRAASGSNPNESLAEISMHDLPSPDDGAESEWDVPTTRPTPVRRSSQLSSQPLPSFIAPTSESRNGLRRMARISVDNFDSSFFNLSYTVQFVSVAIYPSASFPFPSAMPPLPSASVKDVDTELHKSLHRELRSARSRSRSHRERLNSGSSSQAASPQPFESADSPVPPVPAVFPTNSHSLPRRKESLISSVSTADTESQTSGDGRISPDIQNLLERTPRPRRSMSSVRSQGRSSAGASRASSKASMRRRTSDHASIEKEWEEFSASRGRTSQRHLPHSDEKEARLLKLERELDGGGSESEGEDHRNSYGDGFGFGALRDGESDSEASDSSLDLHTPLP